MSVSPDRIACFESPFKLAPKAWLSCKADRSAAYYHEEISHTHNNRTYEAFNKTHILKSPGKPIMVIKMNANRPYPPPLTTSYPERSRNDNSTCGTHTCPLYGYL